MPNRVIKESIWTSPNLNNLSWQAEWFFYRLLPLPDDHGCAELTALVVKGRVFPLRPEVTVKKIEEWTQELVHNDILSIWNENGRIYGFFKTWGQHQRVRSLHQRKTPAPPNFVVNCRQLLASDGLNPNPNPNPNNTCPEAQSTTGQENDTDPPFIFFPTNKTNEECPISSKYVAEMKELYPGVNVEQEIYSMKAWLVSNAKKRKTKDGVLKFINSWLSRAQNKGGAQISHGVQSDGYKFTPPVGQRILS